MDSIQLKAMAKINLGLDVTAKRPDGYHELRMVMQMINLFDRIDIQKIDQPEIQIETNLSFLPVNENNIVYKAADMLIQAFHLTQGVHINLEKHIPVAAGMAGGSSDAATVLYGMNKLFSLGMSKKEMMAYGVKLGADVPYCILRTTALSEGIGEILTSLPPMPKCHILIAKPGISVSTKTVFGKLKIDQIKNHPDIDGIAEAIQMGDLKLIAERLGNTLEEVTVKDYPVIDEIKQEMLRCGALGSLMSGSGPTVFGIFDDLKKAKAAYNVLKQGSLARQVFLTKPVN